MMNRIKKNLFLSRHRRSPGVPPGTVESHQELMHRKVTFQLISYNEKEWSQHAPESIEEIQKLIAPDCINWLNVEGVHNAAVLEQFGKAFGIHPLTLEDISHTDQRAKYEMYPEYDCIILRMLYYSGHVHSEQLTILLFDHLVITFQEPEGGDPFTLIRDRIRNGKGRVRNMKADYLAYALADAVVDYYFALLELISDQLEVFDDKVFSNTQENVLKGLHALKRDLLYIRKSVWPLREVFLGFERMQSKRIGAETRLFVRDLIDHSLRITESVENFRELSTGLIEIYLSGLSQKMNEVMKVLTVISTVFIPVTFIAGVYGMNFDFMPELKSPYGYYTTWGVMLFIMIALLVYFKRKRWI